jgi:hypothetical protein
MAINHSTTPPPISRNATPTVIFFFFFFFFFGVFGSVKNEIVVGKLMRIKITKEIVQKII